MKKKLIIIIDSKWNCGISWKKELGNKYEIASFRDFYIIERLCLEGVVDAVIMNTHLQKECDLNIFRRLRQSFSSLPVIVLISYRCSQDKDELKKWGIDHTVKKPFSMQDLEEKIEEALCEHGSRSIS